MVRKRTKTPTRIERKRKYILKKYDILYHKNFNFCVNFTRQQILNEIDKKKLNIIKKQLLFLIQLSKIY